MIASPVLKKTTGKYPTTLRMSIQIWTSSAQMGSVPLRSLITKWYFCHCFIMESYGGVGGGVSSLPYKSLTGAYQISPMPGKTIFIPWSNHEWNKRSLSKVYSRLVEDWKGLMKGLSTAQRTKIPPTPNVPNHPPILTQTFPDPPQALPPRRLSHTLVLVSLAEDLTRPCSELNG